MWYVDWMKCSCCKKERFYNKYTLLNLLIFLHFHCLIAYSTSDVYIDGLATFQVRDSH